MPLLPPAPVLVGAAALDAAPAPAPIEPEAEPGPDAAVEGRVGAADREPAAAAAVDGRALAVPGLPPADADVEDNKVSPPASESIMGTKSTRRFFTAPFDRAGKLKLAATQTRTTKQWNERHDRKNQSINQPTDHQMKQATDW